MLRLVKDTRWCESGCEQIRKSGNLNFSQFGSIIDSYSKNTKQKTKKSLNESCLFIVRWMILLITIVMFQKVNSQYYLQTIAGSGSSFDSGDGGPALSASLHSPLGIWGDNEGNLYISDFYGSKIRKISATGIITTFIGTGIESNAGPALSVNLAAAWGIYGDSSGNNFYFSDAYYFVWQYNVASGIVARYAGATPASLGYKGDGGPALAAELYEPCGIFLSSVGVLFLADSLNNRIRFINSSTGIINTFAGNGIAGFGPDNISATSSSLNWPLSVWGNTAGVIFIADTSNNCIRKVSRGIITTIAGTGSSTYNGDGIHATIANLYLPADVKGDSVGNLYILEEAGCRIRVVSAQGIISTIIGSTATTVCIAASTTLQLATAATMTSSYGMWIDSEGSIYYTEFNAGYVRKIYYQHTSPPSSQPTDRPSSQPSSRPSHPTSQPSSKPSVPTGQPSSQPTNIPSSHPSSKPSIPTGRPSSMPSKQPSSQPTIRPSSQPSSKPSVPTSKPSRRPSSRPSCKPSIHPSSQPTRQPTSKPSGRPSKKPSSKPSSQPTRRPSIKPSSKPSRCPSREPTSQPSSHPSSHPSSKPSSQPTSFPSAHPSAKPTHKPSSTPSFRPTSTPSERPSSQPTSKPSLVPFPRPSGVPTSQPSLSPSSTPTKKPSDSPSSIPSYQPTVVPSSPPTLFPSNQPTCQPSISPSSQPTNTPTSHPSEQPSASPTAFPSNEPTNDPSISPSSQPTCAPSSSPSEQPAAEPSSRPSSQPTSSPSLLPSSAPSMRPLSLPTRAPSLSPSSEPSFSPSCQPSCKPTAFPSNHPTSNPSKKPSSQPSSAPSLSNLITLAFQTLQIIEGVSYSNFLVITLSELPISSLQISFNLQNSRSDAFVPSTVSFYSFSSLTRTIGLNSLGAGNYTLNVTLSGGDAFLYRLRLIERTEYINVISSSIPLLVESNIALLPPPRLTLAAFSSDGSTVVISFDAATNQGGITTTTFPCSVLLNFTCANLSSCQWSSAKSISANVPTASRCLTLSGIVTLSATAEIASAIACSIGSPCKNVKFADRSTVVTVTAPENAIPPSIVMIMPIVIAECTPLLIDLTSSTGNGGRPWKSRTIQVQSTVGNTSLLNQLQSFLDKDYTFNPPTLLPANFFIANNVYTFMVTLCNFLGVCSQAQKSITIVSTLIPTVFISGSTFITMTRAQQLTVQSNVLLSSCHGASSGIDSFKYAWNLRLGNSSGQITNNVVSTSKDPTQYLLPAYSLSANQIYSVEVSVTLLTSQSTGFASVQIIVNRGDIVAVITGSQKQNMRVQSTILIDGSQSYDEDLQNVYGISAGLQYQWTCAQTLPVLNDSCGGIFASSIGTESTLHLKALANAANAVAQVTLVVKDASNSRSSSAVVTVSVLPYFSPTINLVANYYQMNAAAGLQLTASLNIPANISLNATWKIISGSNAENLINLATTPTIQRFFEAPYVRTKSLYLSFPSNTLAVGTTYTFALTCTGTIMSSTTATVQVSINSPPTLGSFTLTPPKGVEILQDFSFVCGNWIDENLPLTYQFSYLSLSESKVIIRSMSLTAYTSSVLSKGSQSQNYSVIAIADIYDNVMANTSATTVVQVLPRTDSSGDHNSTFSIVRSLLNATGWANVDDIVKGTSIAADVLNQADCSNAPDCTSLNRQSCYSTPHTCGPCISSSLVGVAGDSNEKCYDLASIPLLLSTNESMKTCPGNCSGHGECQYFDFKTSARVKACYSGQLSCISSCVCDIGFQDGGNCALSDQELETKRSLREQVITSIKTYITLQNPSEQGVQGWVGSMSQASQIAAELNNNSIKALLDLSNYAIGVAQSNGYGSNSVQGLLPTLDTVSTALRRVNNQSGLSTTTARSGGSSIMEMLSNYTQLLSAEMVPGQYATTSVQNNFRFTTQVHAPSFTEGQNLSISLPQSAVEAYLNEQSSSLVLPIAPEWPVSVSAIALSSTLFTNSSRFTSDILSLSLSADPCPTKASCETVLVLKSDNSRAGWIVPPSIQSVVCYQGQVINHTISCPNGHNYQVSCTGEGTVKEAKCPGIQNIPTCDGLQGDATSRIGCQVVSFSESNITCSCPLFPSTDDNERTRRILTTTVKNTSNSIITTSYVSLFEAIAENFAETALSAEDLNTSSLSRSWEALVTIGCLIGGIILAMVLSHQADHIEKEKISLEDTLLQVASFPSNSSKRTRETQNITENNRGKKQSKQPTRQGLVSFAEEALPEVLRSQSLTTRMWNEVKRHHRWIGVIYYFSAKFPRVLRVVSLATNVIVMLFIQSLTYAFTAGDDGTCEKLTTESSCLSPRSSYGTGQSKCYWTIEHAKSSINSGEVSYSYGSCLYVQPDNVIEVIIFIAIFSAFVSTPVAILCDWMIHHILSAPTINENKISNKIEIAVISPELSSRESGIFQFEEKFQQLVENEFDQLYEAVMKYHATLSKPEEKEEFESLWAFGKGNDIAMWNKVESTENRPSSAYSSSASYLQSFIKYISSFTSASKHSVAVAIKNELYGLHHQLEKERGRFHLIASEKAKTKRLLYLFQRDLLPGILGQILDSKDNRDNIEMKPVSLGVKRMAWLFLGTLNCGMLFYVFLFAASQDEHRQAAWGRSFGIWLILEIVLVSTSMVILLQIFLPSLIMRDVINIKKRLVENIAKYYQQLEEQNQSSFEIRSPPDTLQAFPEDDNDALHLPLTKRKKKDHPAKKSPRPNKEMESFNAAKYLFLSYRLAEYYSDLKASQIILQFTTPWPKQSYQYITDVSKHYDDTYTAFSRSISLILVFFLTNLLAVPLAIQDMIVHACMTAGIGYTILLHVQLYKIFPVLVIVPTLFLGVLIHFFMGTKEKQDLVNKAKMKELARSVKVKSGSTIYPQKQGDPSEDGQAIEESLVGEEEVLHVHEVILRTKSSKHVTRRKSVQQGIFVATQLQREINQQHEREDVGEEEYEQNDKSSAEEYQLHSDSSDHTDDTPTRPRSAQNIEKQLSMESLSDSLRDDSFYDADDLDDNDDDADLLSASEIDFITDHHHPAVSVSASSNDGVLLKNNEEQGDKKDKRQGEGKEEEKQEEEMSSLDSDLLFDLFEETPDEEEEENEQEEKEEDELAAGDY